MRSITQYCHSVESPHSGVPESQRLREAPVDGSTARGLVRDLVEDVGQTVDGVDDLADVRLLERLDVRVEREDLVVDDRRDRDPVDVDCGVERMAFDVVGLRTEVEGPPVEEHHRDVDTSVARGDDSVTEAVEECLIEPAEVELRFPVRRLSRAGSRPWLRRHAEVEVAAGRLGLELLPAPEPDEVVAVVLEEPEVGVVVELLRGLGAIEPGPIPSWRLFQMCEPAR
jgi:hypothetical protein